MADYAHVDGVRVHHTQTCKKCGHTVSFRDASVLGTMCECGEEVVKEN